jgi:hypothetical protein
MRIRNRTFSNGRRSHPGLVSVGRSPPRPLAKRTFPKARKDRSAPLDSEQQADLHQAVRKGKRLAPEQESRLQATIPERPV